MINDFLKKYQEELNSDRIQLKEDIDLLETKIKEESKFLSLLEESNESYFKEFTPRDINAKNNEKAAEIRLSLENLNSEMNDKLQQMRFFDARIVEINALLSNTAVINRPSKKQNLVNDDVNNDSDSTKSLKDTLLLIKDFVVLDPYRAKLELEKLISLL